MFSITELLIIKDALEAYANQRDVKRAKRLHLDVERLADATQAAIDHLMWLDREDGNNEKA